jgi:hypothetical protein
MSWQNRLPKKLESFPHCRRATVGEQRRVKGLGPSPSWDKAWQEGMRKMMLLGLQAYRRTKA